MAFPKINLRYFANIKMHLLSLNNSNTPLIKHVTHKRFLTFIGTRRSLRFVHIIAKYYIASEKNTD